MAEQATAQGFKRRLVLFLDGTWNREDGPRSTNIVRLREALKLGVDAELGGEKDANRELIDQAKRNPKAVVRGAMVKGSNGEPAVEYVVHYDEGVGTSAFSHLRGGAFGYGLDVNVRQAYRFLSNYYRPGDEIHVFGFSRGAFTARSLVGFIYAAGLLRAETCTTENEAQAWAYYRTPPADRLSGEWRKLQPLVNAGTVEIECLGVFDTVGALGVPLDLFRGLNQETYAFHNTELTSIVKRSFHAVAIDEARRSFEAALWRTPKFKRYGSLTEQVWFPGAHADVGGGYLDWENDEHGLEEIALDWMVKRVRATAKLPFAETGSGPEADHAAIRVADFSQMLAGAPTIHRPWWRLDTLRRPACRMINQVPPLAAEPPEQSYMRVVGRVQHADPIGEAVHISALALLKHGTVSYQGPDRGERYGPRGLLSRFRGAFGRRSALHRGDYRPPNLAAAIPAIAATYWHLADAATKERWLPYVRLKLDGKPRGAPLYVVGWDGRTIADRDNTPADLRSSMTWEDVFAALPEPEPETLGKLGLRPFERKPAASAP